MKPLKREVRIQRLRRVSCTSPLKPTVAPNPVLMPRCGDSHGFGRSQSIALVGACPPSAMICSFFAKKEPKKFQRKRHGPATMPFCVFCRSGGSGTPEFKVENRKNRWKNSLSRRFSRFFRFDFSFGGLGGVQPPSRAPRLGMRGFLPAGLCPAIAPTEYSAMQKPTRSVGSPVHGCSRPRNRGNWAGCLTCRYLWSVKKECIPGART